MAGWLVGFVGGNAEMVSALQQLKSFVDYGTFQPIQMASIIGINEHDSYNDEVVDQFNVRRDTLIDGLSMAGWEIEAPNATMLVRAKIPDRFSDMGSLAFALDLLDKAAVAVSLALVSVPPVTGMCVLLSWRTSTASRKRSGASRSIRSSEQRGETSRDSPRS